MRNIQPASPSTPTAADTTLVNEMKRLRPLTTSGSDSARAGCPADVRMGRAAATTPMACPRSSRYTDAL